MTFEVNHGHGGSRKMRVTPSQVARPSVHSAPILCEAPPALALALATALPTLFGQELTPQRMTITQSPTDDGGEVDCQITSWDRKPTKLSFAYNLENGSFYSSTGTTGKLPLALWEQLTLWSSPFRQTKQAHIDLSIDPVASLCEFRPTDVTNLTHSGGNLHVEQHRAKFRFEALLAIVVHNDLSIDCVRNTISREITIGENPEIFFRESTVAQQAHDKASYADNFSWSAEIIEGPELDTYFVSLSILTPNQGTAHIYEHQPFKLDELQNLIKHHETDLRTVALHFAGNLWAKSADYFTNGGSRFFTLPIDPAETSDLVHSFEEGLDECGAVIKRLKNSGLPEWVIKSAEACLPRFSAEYLLFEQEPLAFEMSQAFAWNCVRAARIKEIARYSFVKNESHTRAAVIQYARSFTPSFLLYPLDWWQQQRSISFLKKCSVEQFAAAVEAMVLFCSIQNRIPVANYLAQRLEKAHRD